MSTATYAFGILAAVLALVAIVELMRRGTLRERHAVWWFVGGTLALLIAVFPQLLGWAASLIGVAVPTNLVFFVAIALLFLVSLQYGSELTRVEEKLRVLAERSAFHERRLRELESTESCERDEKQDEPGESSESS
ncbi:DUF2304 domain-containing protein [Microbacterium esteraromaticum]|uniref:DUF2304 family protein n=1 Tax=Microbacterium esteraromaticum TaxID=57043 RepID=UPI001A8C19CE|nr:DUF2304 domain-containing protein [Microbacterium esteraromaticum]